MERSRVGGRAEWRTRGVGRADFIGARNARQRTGEPERSAGRSGIAFKRWSAGLASVPAFSAAEGAQRLARSGPRDCCRGGSVAPTPRGEPAVSRSGGPCGPSAGSEATGAEGRSAAERDTDPPSAAAEVMRKPKDGAGSPPGTLRRTRSSC